MYGSVQGFIIFVDKTMDVEGSLLHTLVKEAVRKTERLNDFVINDKVTKYTPAPLEHHLAELGFHQNEDNGMFVTIAQHLVQKTTSTNLWDEDMATHMLKHKLRDQPRAASLNSLIKILTKTTMPDNKFTDNFINTYLSFTTCTEFITKLAERFIVPEEFKKDKQAIELIVFDVLKRWTEVYCSTLSKAEMKMVTSCIHKMMLQPFLKKQGLDLLTFIDGAVWTNCTWQYCSFPAKSAGTLIAMNSLKKWARQSQKFHKTFLASNYHC